jgi:hypothetical protein
MLLLTTTPLLYTGSKAPTQKSILGVYTKSLLLLTSALLLLYTGSKAPTHNSILGVYTKSLLLLTNPLLLLYTGSKAPTQKSILGVYTKTETGTFKMSVTGTQISCCSATKVKILTQKDSICVRYHLRQECARRPLS